MGKFREELQSPPNEYRSSPFWAWNDWMKPTKIRQQMEQMKKQRMGGCFIHSREGLETEYLSKDWMECVKETVRYGKEKELDVWIYDEDKWPSGMAGGMVVKEHPQCRAKALTLQMNLNGTHTYQIESSMDSDWYNGFGPADNLDPCSVRFFLEQTHEEYKKTLPEFGDVKGFFTDEPNVCDFFAHFTKGRPWLPWSDQFEVFFEEKRGYQIQRHLDALFFDTPDAPKIRNDYCKTITELFSDSYFRQISEWLHDHNMKFTGHLLFENDLGYNSRTSGAIMPHYRFFDIPGIDILGEQDEELLTVKQCTSVAHQFGKKHVMSETYGCTKWDFGLEGQKWLGDWQFIMGVTMRCQHLFMYSIKGLRKRDYPPVFSPQTTWWEHTHILEDYFARFSVCSTYGEVNREILVLHPQSSAWLHAGSRAEEDLGRWDDNMGWLDEHFKTGNQMGATFQRIIRGLLASHRDCDLGDEMLMEEYGRVEDKMLYVGQAGYKIVLIPPIENIFASTIKLLYEFMEQGGIVITTGEAPRYVDGERSCEGEKLYQSSKLLNFSTEDEAIGHLRSLPKEIHIIKNTGFEDEDIWSMYRTIPEGKMLICSNHDRDKAHEIQIGIEGKGRIEKIDLVEGTSRFILGQYEERTNKMVFTETLGAVETVVYILHEGSVGEEKAPAFSYKHPHEAKNIVAGLDIKAPVSRDLPNVLPLDYCRYRYQNVSSDEMPLWQAQKEIREILDMCPNWYNGAPQRYTWNKEKHKNDSSYLELEYSFVVADEGVQDIQLIAEELQRFDVICNGEKIYTRGEILSEDAFFLECAMKRVNISNDYIRLGENQLILQIPYEQDMELEDMYLLGEFAVNQKREIIKEEKILQLGDWCLQGYPHYVGGMTYHFSLEIPEKQEEGAYLYLQEWKAAVAEIYVNQQFVKTIGWKGQDGVDISSYLKTGNNQIDIKLTASPRNLFGPFHQKYEAGIRSSFKDFRTEGKEYTKEYLVEPQGLMKPVIIVAD